MENIENKTTGKGGIVTFFLIIAGIIAALIVLKMIIG